jgi:hypothetical protein
MKRLQYAYPASMEYRVPAELLIHWISEVAAVREDSERSGTGNDLLDFLRATEEDAWLRWTRRDLSIEAVIKYFSSIRQACEQARATQLAFLAQRYENELALISEHTEDHAQEAALLARLDGEYFGRRFESVLRKYVRENASPQIRKNAMEIGRFIADTLDSVQSDKKDEAIIVLRNKLSKRWKWGTALVRNSVLKNLFESVVPDDPETIRENFSRYLRSSMETPYSLMVLADVAYRFSGVLQRIFPEDMPAQFRFVTTVKTYRREIKYAMRENEDSDPGDPGAGVVRGIYKSYLKHDEAQEHTKAALYNGTPYVRGFSGHTTAMLHLIVEARKQGYQIDPRYAVLIVMIWGVNKGRHATYGVLLAADHFNEPLDLRLGSLGRDALYPKKKAERIKNYQRLVDAPDEFTRSKAAEALKANIVESRFVPDLHAFLSGFHDEKTRQVIDHAMQHAKKDAVEAVRASYQVASESK